MVGAAVNWYYHSAFASVVISQTVPEVKPWKLYERTDRYTVEDGCLVGAGLGLVAALVTLRMRRPAISPWVRCVGMVNVGACAGIAGAHAYFQYTGERQQAYRSLDQRLKRRLLEFWWIFWDKNMMAEFNPLLQHYVRHNGIWYTHLLPHEVFEQMDANIERIVKDGDAASQSETSAVTAVQQEEPPYYSQPFDYADNLRRFDAQYTIDKMEEMETYKLALLKDAEFLLFFNAQQKHEYCHLKGLDEEEKSQRRQEMRLTELAYNRLRHKADDIDVMLVIWRLSLQHKAAFESKQPTDHAVDSWLPEVTLCHPKIHDPVLSIEEMQVFQAQLFDEVRRFEAWTLNTNYPKESRERWSKDLDDGRVMLRAADRVVYELEKMQKAVMDQGSTAEETSERSQYESLLDGQTNRTKVGENMQAVTAESTVEVEKDEKAQADEEKVVKPPDRGLEPEKP